MLGCGASTSSWAVFSARLRTARVDCLAALSVNVVPERAVGSWPDTRAAVCSPCTLRWNQETQFVAVFHMNPLACPVIPCGAAPCLALQSLVAALKGVGASIAERVGPIHIGEAERGLLETIWLLLTSIVCVPAVCKLIPGGSPVLGYLVSCGVGLCAWCWSGEFALEWDPALVTRPRS